MEQLLFLIILYSPLSETMNGVIWNKMQKTFVPISSVPMYAMIQQERHRQSRALETHNFQLQNLTVTSFKVRKKRYLYIYFSLILSVQYLLNNKNMITYFYSIFI